MKISSLILPAINGLVWSGLSWMGWNGIKAVESQHAAGYPSPGQIGYYLAIPLVMLTISLVPSALLSQTKWSVLGNVWCGLTLIAVVPYLLPYGSGV
jgi:hypothetical protein